MEPPHSKALTTAGSVMGTPDYIAPEQARDAHSADIRADIYSLGCTLHFLLTGKPPFEADNVLAKLKAHAQVTPPALTALRKDVPIELEQVASRMLAKNPIERFQTPAEVVAALRPFTKSVAFRSAKGRSFAERKTTLATVLGVVLLLAGVIVVTSNRGRLEIHSEVEDVKVSVTKGGEQVEVFDLKTGSQMKWLPSGEYELQVVGKGNDVKLDKAGFTMSRLGQVIVTANWNAAGRSVVRAFSTAEKPITQDGVVVDEGGWKIAASENRTVRLFEMPNPNLDIGPFFFRAKLRTENVTGRAYLELWNRFPGKGEFFSKGIQHAVSGTTGWAEYEIPFYLKKGEQPDLVKLNVTIEGRGTVWIKDIELRGRTIGHSSDSATPASTDPASLGTVEREALKVAEAFLAVVDEGNFDKLYDSGSNLAKKQAKREQVVPLYQQIRDMAGKVETRTLQRVRLIDEFIGLPPGRYAAVQYVSDFAKHKGLWETVMLNVDDDGQWRANTYAVTVQPLPLPEPKDKTQPSVSSPPQSRAGLLTNPPKLPPEGVLVGRNLIVDPSLEETPTGELPQGWFAWLDDGPDFKC
ncbi:MAG: DUF4019 domain-containing protein, partial [Candidatus Saccharimonas sp.]|nr:DUF4019 domain-containing protein [Planctomycetaceae bacterium]